MSHNNIYSDDYRQHDASYDQQHPYQAHQSTFERNDYHENPPYDDDSIVQPHHPEIMTADDYRQYPSTEKIVGDEYQTPNTARAQPGRSGLRDNSTSWAAGPPPRSTGILRMWRHDERGKQWLRVNPPDWHKTLYLTCLGWGIAINASYMLLLHHNHCHHDHQYRSRHFTSRSSETDAADKNSMCARPTSR